MKDQKQFTDAVRRMQRAHRDMMKRRDALTKPWRVNYGFGGNMDEKVKASREVGSTAFQYPEYRAAALAFLDAIEPTAREDLSAAESEYNREYTEAAAELKAAHEKCTARVTAATAKREEVFGMYESLLLHDFNKALTYRSASGICVGDKAPGGIIHIRYMRNQMGVSVRTNPADVIGQLRGLIAYGEQVQREFEQKEQERQERERLHQEAKEKEERRLREQYEASLVADHHVLASEKLIEP